MRKEIEKTSIGPHREITKRILKCAFAIQNTLGCGFLEKVYENALMVAMKREGLDSYLTSARRSYTTGA